MGQDSSKVLRGEGFPVCVSTAMPLTEPHAVDAALYALATADRDRSGVYFVRL